MTSKLKMTGIYILLIVATIISVFPLLWMVIAATNKSVDVISGKLTFGANLIENYNMNKIIASNIIPPPTKLAIDF